MSRWILVAGLVFLASCQLDPKAADPVSGHDPNAAETGRATCEAKGGTFARAGKSTGLICVENTKDAGKSCTSGAQCDGLCLARSGTCAPIKPLFGCHDIFTLNGSRATICID